MSTAYRALPALVAEHPGQCAAFYAGKLGIGDTSVDKALRRLAREGVLVAMLEETRRRDRNRMLYFLPDDVDLPPPVHLCTSSWESVRVPPGPRSIFDLATCSAL